MDPRFSGEILKHLEKLNELLKNAYDSMSQELHKLQVEEEMLMRKFYELMSSQGLTKRNGNGRKCYILEFQFPGRWLSQELAKKTDADAILLWVTNYASDVSTTCFYKGTE